MSAIKRWLDAEVERIADENGYSWDDVMDRAADLEFDMERLEVEAKNHLF